MNQVAAKFPGWPMISPSYPTRDHLMPWRLFAILAADLKHLIAAERRTLANAIRDAFGGDPIVEQTVTDLAMPEVGPAPEPQVLFEKKKE